MIKEKEFTKREWKIILIALTAMKDTYVFMRGFGTITRQERILNDLITKVNKQAHKDEKTVIQEIPEKKFEWGETKEFNGLYEFQKIGEYEFQKIGEYQEISDDEIIKVDGVKYRKIN